MERIVFTKANKLAEKIDLKFLKDFMSKFIKKYGYKPKI
jgi:hypothetical protein